MIKIQRIKIKGFKDNEIEKELIFSKEPITVIYGQNGSGKSTLLKILHGVFNRNERILINENVSNIEINYIKNDEEKTLFIKRTTNNKIDWSQNCDLFETSSILFGVHRGVTQDKLSSNLTNNSEVRIIMTEIRNLILNPLVRNQIGINRFNEKFNYFLRPGNEIDYREFVIFYDEIFSVLLSLNQPQLLSKIEQTKKRFDAILFDQTIDIEKIDNLKNIYEQQHISTDFIKINDIKNSIIQQYRIGQNIISERIKSAFFETIENAVTIEEDEQKDFKIPENFADRIEGKKDFIKNAIPLQKNSNLTEKLKLYFDTKDITLTEKSKIFRAMLLNILEKAEELNPALEAIIKLIEIFNSQLSYGKKLVIEVDKAYIDLGNNKFHNLSDLSSGERNLLSMLTLFLVIGLNRDFLMIDEPEISLNIQWQRDFLPLLSTINSHAQIIVASHSPSIAHKNSKYLVELI